MNIRTFIGAGAAATLLIAGTVAAQSGVTVSTTPVTSVISPSTQAANLGTVTVSGPSGTAVTSIPITVTAGGGASIANLSNCRLFDNANVAATTGANAIGSLQSGANSFTLDNPLVLSGGATTYTVRCDVAANTSTGATFAIQAGTPSMVTTAPLSISLDVAPTVPRGANDVALANIFLRAGTADAMRVSSLPIAITASSDTSVSYLSDCRIRDASNLPSSLTGGINPTGGTTVFAFATPAIAPAFGVEALNLTCDVSASAPIGGTFTISVEPSTAVASNVSTGATVTPHAGQTTTGSLIVTGATNGTGTPGIPDTGGTPGIPNTGLGGNAALMYLVLSLAALTALGGAAYIRYRMA